eukprot:2356582-Pyramimonas_sp.AAC.1
MQAARVYSHDGPIRCRRRGYTLTTATTTLRTKWKGKKGQRVIQHEEALGSSRSSRKCTHVRGFDIALALSFGRRPVRGSCVTFPCLASTA